MTSSRADRRRIAPEDGTSAANGRSGDNSRSLSPSVVLRPLGTPLPLGMAGLAVATVMLAALNLGIVPTSDQHEAALALILFAVPLQATAAVFGLLARDPVVGSGFGVQATGWLAAGVLLLLSPPGSTSPVLAVLLFAAAGALVSSVVVAAQSKLVPAAVMAGTVARWVLTGVYELLGNVAVERAGGYEGLALALLAIYTAVAADLESSRQQSVLPLGRIGRGRRVVEGDLHADLGQLAGEPGVRPQL